MRWDCSIRGFQILVLMMTLFITLNVQAKKPENITPAPQPTRESLEKRIHELIDAAVRKDEKKIASILLGGKGERHSWNRQVIWEYMAHQRSRDCKNITIYIVGYTAYTSFWCSDKQPTGPCPERKGESRYWVFRGGQWYMADPPYKNYDPLLQQNWRKFIQDHKNQPCDPNDDQKVKHKTEEFIDLMISGKIDEAAQMISPWSNRNVFDTSFNLEECRIDKACSFYQYDILGKSPTVSYEMVPSIRHWSGGFSVEDSERTCFFEVTVILTKTDGSKKTTHLNWLYEDGVYKIWHNWYN